MTANSDLFASKRIFENNKETSHGKIIKTEKFSG